MILDDLLEPDEQVELFTVEAISSRWARIVYRTGGSLNKEWGLARQAWGRFLKDLPDNESRRKAVKAYGKTKPLTDKENHGNQEAEARAWSSQA